MGQESAALPREPEPAPAEESDEEPGEEYDAREDELDAPRDYDDYTDNAHLAHNHD